MRPLIFLPDITWLLLGSSNTVKVCHYTKTVLCSNDKCDLRICICNIHICVCMQNNIYNIPLEQP